MERIQSSDGTPIAFDRSGEGPPVILVPGLFQHRAIDPGTAELAALLAPRFTVFHYDRRGRGDSGDTAPYAVEREVEDVGALIDEAGGAAALYGMSSGGALALEAAARGLAVTKLAVYEPPFTDDEGTHRPVGGARRRGRRARRGGPPRRRGRALHDQLGRPRRGGRADAPGAVLGRARERGAHDALRPDADGRHDAAERAGAHDRGPDAGARRRCERRRGGAGRPTRSPRPSPARSGRTLEGQTHEVAAEPLAPVLAEFFGRP